MKKLKIKKLHNDAIVPTYGTAGAACFDLYACDIPAQDVSPGIAENVILADKTVLRTGLSFEVPEGFVMLVFSRSGHGFKNDTRLANCVGVIDADYRGEVMVKLTADFPRVLMQVRNGDRIAQAMIIPVEQYEFELAEELSETVRGTGGFGSTGS
jgi:dUTP pyrophosphatase